MVKKLEFRYNSVAASALRSSTNELLLLRDIDYELNKQFPDASYLKKINVYSLTKVFC